MVETAGFLCPESKNKLGKNELITQNSDSSCWANWRRLSLQAKQKKTGPFTLCSFALDGSNGIKDTTQLFIFIRGINDNYEITGRFWPWNSWRGNPRRGHVWQHVRGHQEAQATSECPRQHYHRQIAKSDWKKHRVAQKNPGGLREDDPEQEVIFCVTQS